MSGPAAYRGPDGLLGRSCRQHGSYVVHESGMAGCPRCRENARDRERQRLARKRRGLVCDECHTDLLTPAARCGFCMGPDEHDAFAVLAAMDAETSPTPRERQ